eukprot:scaffold9875_cov67-Phaeocystis_antarctica.AAC.1
MATEIAPRARAPRQILREIVNAPRPCGRARRRYCCAALRCGSVALRPPAPAPLLATPAAATEAVSRSRRLC